MAAKKNDVLSREISEILLNLDQKTSGREIITSLSGFCHADEATLYALLGAGVIKTASAKRKISDYIFSIDKNKAKNIGLLKSLLFSGQKEPDLPIFELVASYPSHGGYGEISRINGVESLYPMLCRLIITADRQILMANPFFDEAGADKILPYIKGAADRGVNIKIVSRSPREGGARLWRKLENEIKEMGENCEVRYFGGFKGRRRFYLHAKFMVADGTMAYVGSANITKTSLGDNAEVGIIFGGRKVSALGNFFKLLWDNSSQG